MCKKKHTKGNPFYRLQFSFEEDRGLVLEPRPVLSNSPEDLGPPFILKDFWPLPDILSLELPPVLYYCGLDGHILHQSMEDIINLAETAEMGNTHCCHSFSLAINAFLYHHPLTDRRVYISDEEELKKRGLKKGGYVVIPVQFFHIDAEVPKEIRRHAKLLEKLGI